MRLTSTLLASAIAFAKSQSGMAQALVQRDNNPNLYLTGLVCKINVYTEQPGHFYLRVIFDYAAFSHPDAREPDLYIDLKTHSDGSFEVLPPPLGN